MRTSARVAWGETRTKKIMKTYEKKNLRGHALQKHKEKLQSIGFSQEQKDILIGTLLGDASMQAMKGNQMSNVKFEQKIEQTDYVNHLYEHFQDWVGTPPSIRYISGGNAADRQSIWFKTYRHSSLTFFKNIFYRTDVNGKQYKIVPKLIHRWLTPRALAYWYMDDGCGKRDRDGKVEAFTLNTQGFTLPEQNLLVSALSKNFKLHVTIQKDKGSHRIYIGKQSGASFVDIIRPYIRPTFLYKIS
uniref:LAGLIDADG homing endonuclease n=1 Tax=Marophrys sp. SRT127 TaxID=2488311 RepID=A0A455REK7_9EUKA|nr:LAGLIDADG homing endonuclease [Marophrys sp. SRT127]